MRKIESFLLGLNLFQDRSIIYMRKNALNIAISRCNIQYNICVSRWNSLKIALASSCDVNMLEIPDNGKFWNYNPVKKIWELECELNYEIERG